MNQVVFSKAAAKDRSAITAYTVGRFGIDQARRLRQQIEITLNVLAESPLAGHPNKELDPPGHSFRYATVMKTFLIVYEPVENGIRVVRLIHGARNLAAELTRDPGKDDS